MSTTIGPMHGPTDNKKVGQNMTDAKKNVSLNRTVVVTGAGAPRGIGRILAVELAEQGYAVALVDLNEEGLRSAEEEMTAAGFQAIAVPTDVSSEESVNKAFDTIDKAGLPPVYGLVNLAGIASPIALMDISVADWDRVMAVNVTGSLLMMKGAAKRMIEAGQGGRVVNTSSITAFDGGGTFSKGGYAAAKAAVLGLTRGAARELGPHGITVNVIAPGPIDTDIMGGKLTDERKAGMSSTIPVGRIGQPQEVAALLAFLLSDGAGFISGATYQIDGGKYMH